MAEMFLDEPNVITPPFPWSPIGDSEMARNEFEDGSKWCATSNTCSSVNEAGFGGLRTYVQKPMKLCSNSGLLNRSLSHLGNTRHNNYYNIKE